MSKSIPRTAEEYRAWWQATSDVPYGLCRCGCGEPTNIAKRNEYINGYIKGEPYPRLRNHHRRQSPHPYVEQDLGHDTPCWVWQWSKINSTDDRQYGKAAVEGGVYRPAHRVYYEHEYGPIPEGYSVHHLCCVNANTGSTLCVRPSHLQAVTQAENVQAGNRTKLTAKQVREIRQLYAEEEYTFMQLGAMFGVNYRTISGVVHRRAWRNIS